MFSGERMTPRPGEMAWTEDDVEYVLEWQRMQDAICPGCGQPREESFDPDYADAYVTHVRRCHACAAQARTVEEKHKTLSDTHGLYASVERDGHSH